MKNYCPNCKTVFDGSKSFCTQCGTPLQVLEENDGREVSKAETQPLLSEQLSVIKNKVIWNVPMGEVAFRISEKEMESMNNIAGIVINEGVTANIFIDGLLKAEVHGGTYDFIDPKELEERLNTRTGGFPGWVKHGWNKLVSWILGARIKEKIQGQRAIKIDKNTTMDDIIASMREDSVCSIILKLDKEFPLGFETEISTEEYTGKAGVMVTAQITNFNQFIQYFSLTEHQKSVTNNQLRDLFADTVRTCLRGESFSQGKFTSEDKERLQNRLQAKIFELNTGISIVRVIDCSIQSEDLDRLRDLNREIYLSNQEIDRLHNINIVKNRLTNEENQQRIEEAQSERDIAKILMDIDKDRILNDDDMQTFLETIQNTKVLRQARNEDELEQAISEIKKAKLLRQTDIDLLIAELNEKQYKVATAFSLLQLQDTIERQRIEQSAIHDTENREMQHKMEMDMEYTKHQISISQITDAYKDERFIKELEMSSKLFMNNLEQRKLMSDQEMKERLDNVRVMDEQQRLVERMNESEHQHQMERLNAINAHDLNKDSALYSHEENMSSINVGKTKEQIEAEQLSKLSAEAQAAYFNSQHNKETAEAQARAERDKAEFLKQMYDQQRQDSSADKDRMERLAMKAFDVAAGNSERERSRGDEYKENLYRTQGRFDRQQEQLINHAFRPTERPASPQQPNGSQQQPNGYQQQPNGYQQQPQVQPPLLVQPKEQTVEPKQKLECPNCGNTDIQPTDKCCGKCGYNLKG